ncbi:polysaccharide pyruvyl transferase family protein [Luteipulveratus halotolerans]|uniref:Polysaccharide pyruvyl transferase domain-containing protein n=1 Tax=Luteipulveratus halotolerans TaxID=1631356 RepID=A0A0L6CEE4_9MICO|nr:polysaccharide pyruvyl transferase family protein [Luteipulveratus halotolerans]KNX36182.1 hypothetical protein VV01_01900 [Luteipulveratus halotolerans]
MAGDVTRIVVMHAYSAGNLGDGLLVQEAVALLHEAFGSDVELTLVARDPDSFTDFDGTRLPSLPSAGGLAAVPAIARTIRRADLVVSVGGGYARGDTATAFTKYAVVHGTQTALVGALARRSLYLPQSVGPFHRTLWPVVRSAYNRIDLVALRDDRSVEQLGGRTAERVPDSAILTMDRPAPVTTPPARPVVLSVRTVSPRARTRLETLARSLGSFDGYVQSATLGNDDTAPMHTLGPARVVPRTELLSPESPRRVVVAVRLHAALMALRAGHHVVHLAYERKGFGAFQDLRLPAYCHNVNTFEPAAVVEQVQLLLTDPAARHAYDQHIREAMGEVTTRRAHLVDTLRTIAAGERP